MNNRLYYDDPYLHTFEASVLKWGTEPDGTPYVVLDSTAFYPTGGGQPCDLGELGGIRVIDVVEVDGDIRHRLEAPLPQERQQIAGQIDWPRRFDHMQQHAGQHILSASFVEVLGAETVAFHLGRDYVTIDVRLDELSIQQAEQVEALANRIVLENRPIEARFVTDAELALMPLCKQPTVSENIRVVIIPDFDYNPCGGTHPARTGEVGPIKIIGWERHRGNIRVTFLCGWRALADYSRKHLLLRELTRTLSAGEPELAEQVQRLVTEREQLKAALEEKETQLLEGEAQSLLAQAVPLSDVRLVKAVWAGRSMQQLQQLARLVTAQAADAVCLFAAEGDKLQILFARGEQVAVAQGYAALDRRQRRRQSCAGPGRGRADSSCGSGAGTRLPAAGRIDQGITGLTLFQERRDRHVAVANGRFGTRLLQNGRIRDGSVGKSRGQTAGQGACGIEIPDAGRPAQPIRGGCAAVSSASRAVLSGKDHGAQSDRDPLRWSGARLQGIGSDRFGAGDGQTAQNGHVGPALSRRVGGTAQGDLYKLRAACYCSSRASKTA
ncbi:Ser-tRNA(Ala) deacylase AlaX [Brevibacillus aydinogluensis]|jgi:alanyl-tRNA synthetase|nr:Ser-tRNA(Ala) deacylase AlaX [Brevibacillus aydinogluensis]